MWREATLDGGEIQTYWFWRKRKEPVFGEELTVRRVEMGGYGPHTRVRVDGIPGSTGSAFVLTSTGGRSYKRRWEKG